MRSAALSSADGSIRMSSGASVAYGKPRSGRSSCIDDTPRSSRIASASTPFAASCSSTSENSPRSSRGWRLAVAPLEALEVRADGRVAVDRDVAAAALEVGREQRRVAAGAEGAVDDGLAGAHGRAAAALPRRGREGDQSLFAARRSATSSALPSTSASSRLHVSRSQISRWSRIPATTTSRFSSACWRRGAGDHHAALFVEFGLGRSREEEPLEPPRFLAERIQRGESRLDVSNPILTTEHLETPLDAPCDDDAVRRRTRGAWQEG